MIHPDLDAIYKTILREPDCDAHKLIYADRLEEWVHEHGGLMSCPNCSDACKLCGSVGSVSNGFAERVELIRIQMELAQMQPYDSSESVVRRRSELKLRETDILTVWDARWRNGWNTPVYSRNTLSRKTIWGNTAGYYDGGFLSEVNCDYSDLFDETDNIRQAAVLVVKTHPIKRFRLLDCSPQKSVATYLKNTVVSYDWNVIPLYAQLQHHASYIPSYLFEEIQKLAAGGNQFIEFPSIEAANRTMSIAVANLVRKIVLTTEEGYD